MAEAKRDSESQSDKFRAAARRIGCDEDEVRWTERLKKVVKAKPSPEGTGPDGTT